MIDFLPNPEQSSLVDAVVDYLRTEMPVERLRPLPASANLPEQRDAWPGLASLGWFGLGLAEAQGGSGYGAVEQMLLHREAGHYLVSPAVIGGVLAAHQAATADALSLSARIVQGDVRVGLALPSTGLVSHHRYLVDAASAKLVLTCGTDPVVIHERSAFDAAASGEVPSLDPSVHLLRACLRPDATPALASAETASSTLLAHLLLAAMQVGHAEAVRDMAVSYALMREQFGQPIGGFQAIKHQCADMAVRAESAYAQTVLAALRLAQGAPDAAFHVAAAAVAATRAAIDNAEANIQIHGGVGFTLECDAHLFLKRAHLVDALLGGVRSQQRRLLAQTAPA